MKKHFIILTISQESFDYNILISYLHTNPNVVKISILPFGLLIKIVYEKDEDRKKLFQDIIKLDIENIISHEILYEEFIPHKFDHKFEL